MLNGKKIGTGKKSVITPALDKELLQIITDIRASGAEVHLDTVSNQAVALLERNGLGHILKKNNPAAKGVFGNAWASEWLKKHNFSDRQGLFERLQMALNCSIGTRAKKSFVLTQTILDDFLFGVSILVNENNIPPELVINFDETGLELCAAGKRTFAQKGSIQVEIIGIDDKRQITAGSAASMRGEKLDVQLIFKGKTKRCYPEKEKKGFLYCHSDSHWQTPQTTEELLDSIILPFFVKKRQEMELPKDQWCLLLWDVWNSHIHADIRAKCNENHVKMRIITPNYTRDLQVMDTVVNKNFKAAYRREFGHFCSNEINGQIQEGATGSQAQIALGMKKLKDEIPNWTEKAWEVITPASIENGFKKIGFEKCWQPEFYDRAKVEKERLFGLELVPQTEIVVEEEDEVAIVILDRLDATPAEIISNEEVMLLQDDVNHSARRAKEMRELPKKRKRYFAII